MYPYVAAFRQRLDGVQEESGSWRSHDGQAIDES